MRLYGVPFKGDMGVMQGLCGDVEHRVQGLGMWV